MHTIHERPLVFNQMTGQPLILKEFKSRSKDLSFANNMLFVGQSGSGKSTAAFIIAKLLNCHNPILNEEGYYEPCNECKSCKAVIDQTYNRDISYLDATYMGKAEVESLREKTRIRPSYDKNKIIIIDEAHLLNSKEARGGMLTLTEQKNPNVFFILCTTDSSKFDQAFRSRFIQYKFKEVGEKDMGLYLIEQLKKKEEVQEERIEEIAQSGILVTIVENAYGSVRQALQYLDRVLQAELTTVEEVEEEFGFISSAKVFMFIDMLMAGNAQAFWSNLSNYSDPSQVYYYLSTIAQSIAKLDIGYEDSKKETHTRLKKNILEKYRTNFYVLYNSLVQLHKDMPSYFSRYLFESAMISYFKRLKGKTAGEIVLEKKESAPARRPVRRPVR